MSIETEVVADDAVEPKERSIREEIEAARDEINSRQENDGVRDQSQLQHDHSASGSAGIPRGRESNSGNTRQRGPDGKFTSDGAGDQQTTQVPAEVRPESGTANTAVGVAAPEGSPQPVALPAPQSWNAEEKKLWAQLPAAAQQIVTRREHEAHRRITEHDEIRGVGNQFMTAANEYAPLIQARGGNPVALFREFLGIVNQIHNSDPSNRANIFRQLAAQNGVDLRVLGMAQQPGAQPQGQQPNVPIDQLVQRAIDERFQARQRQEAQEREQAEMQATHSEIEAFRSKVDANGQTAYPYFDHVNGLMAAILSAGNASTLEEAYQLAVKAHPETSKLLEQSAQAAAQAAEAKRLKAQAARRKGGSLPSGGGTPPQLNGSGGRSIRDELKAAFEESRGRV